jgi:tRNA 5-methylaminomethyl-2-thiouridine biosynthesis bifunctional protein
MWSPEVLRLVRERSASGARLATFTVAGAVRRGLAEQGFAVEKRPGHGRKRERLEARLVDTRSENPSKSTRVAVIGGGIAGAAMIRALRAVGVQPLLIEAERPGAGSSGFPAALVTPRLDAGDAVIAGLHAQALERARHLYDQVEGAVLAKGVLQLEQAPRDAARFARIADQAIWRPGAMTVFDADQAGAVAGEPVSNGGLMMADALVLHPETVLDAWLEDTMIVPARVHRLAHQDGLWRLIDADDREIAAAEAVVLCGGWGSSELMADLGLPVMAPVRGQADWIEGEGRAPLAWGGYLAPARQGLLFGATHDREDTDTTPRDADSRRNLQTLAARLPVLAERVAQARPRHSRAAIRATTPDRLPLCGEVPGHPGLHLLTGLGSRGFCVAPLLAEHVAAEIAGAPSPLPATYAARVSPARFMGKTEPFQQATD